MIKWIVRAVLLVVVGAASHEASSGTPPATRHVKVIATVQKADGERVADVMVIASATNEGLFCATDASGRAVIEGEVAASATSCLVFLFPGSKSPVFNEAGPDHAAVYRQLAKNWWFDRYYEVPLEAGVAEYSVVVTLHPAIKVRGRIVNADGRPESASIYRNGYLAPFDVETDGRFEVLGVRRSAEGWLLVQPRDTPATLKIPLTAAQTGSDLDLGDIVVPTAAVEGERFSVSATNLRGRGAGFRGNNLTVTVVEATSAAIFRFSLKPDGTLRDIAGHPPKLPPGSYYLVPGSISMSHPAEKLVRLVEKGRHKALEAEGAVRFDVRPGSPVQVELDGEKAEAAVNAVKEE